MLREHLTAKAAAWVSQQLRKRVPYGASNRYLDAAHMQDEPQALIELPARVPPGFHGNWIPD